HQLVWFGQVHWKLPGPFKVTAPPVGVALILFNSLHKNQPLWISRQDGIACLLGSQSPIRAGVATAPGSRAMRLVGQVCPDHGVTPPVVPGQHNPILDPPRLGYMVGVPEFGPDVGSGIMAVEN